MSQNPSTDSFLNENSQKNQHNPSSQFNNNSSLNILNKISAISIKNISKNNSFDFSELSFLQDIRPGNPLSNIKESPLKSVLSRNNRENLPPLNIQQEKRISIPKEELGHKIEDLKTSCEKQNIFINKIETKIKKSEYPDRNEDKQDFHISNKKSININLADKSVLSNNKSENFDFLLKDWQDYFYDEEPAKIKIEDDYRHIILRTVYQCYSYPEFNELIEWGNEKKYGVIDCFLDYQKLKQISIDVSMNSSKYDQKTELFQILSEIMDYLSQCPADLLHSFDLALDVLRVKILKKSKRRVITRIYNLPFLTSLPDIKSNIISHYIAIKGIILKTSPVKLLTKSMKFICMECHKSFNRKFIDGIYIPPSCCDNAPKCKSKVFQPDKSSAQTILYQRIKLQEIDEDSGSGRVPRNLDCELKENLVSCVISGDTVIFNGILKTEAFEDNKGNGGAAGKKNQQGLFNMYMDVNSVLNCKDKSKSISNKTIASIEEEFTEEDLKLMESLMSLAQNRRLFPLLIKSFCPSIYGHEIVKAGLLLAIVGGSSEPIERRMKNTMFSDKFLNGKEPSFRNDCHVLLIGDPGLGKSQLLKYVANIAPRSVYVCGKSSSTVGLTVAVSKDASGEGSLEAGALVLSDQGVCCIDEFDKMDKEHLALLESMEQQTVSIAKSGVLCSLQTRTTIIASANPVGGNYNKQKNIRDNIKISNAILSRFDLIFLMLDEPDPKRDQKLSEHVMRLHNHKKRKRTEFENTSFNHFQQNSEVYSQINMNFDDYLYGKQTQNHNFRTSFDNNQQETVLEGQFIGNHYFSLSEKLSKMCEGINKTLQTNVLRKYISYVKKNIHPYLSSEASQILKCFYMKLRENNDSASSIAITTRQLESLIRLSQARAKLEFRTEVTKEDAIEVVELMQESLFDALEDMTFTQNNKLAAKSLKNVNKLTNIGVLSVPKQTKLFVEKLNEEAANKNSDLFEYQDLLRIAKGLNMSMGSDFASYIDKLNFESYLIMKNPKLYQLVVKKEF